MVTLRNVTALADHENRAPRKRMLQSISLAIYVTKAPARPLAGGLLNLFFGVRSLCSRECGCYEPSNLPVDYTCTSAIAYLLRYSW